jgi:plasmid maintenance system killer protein
VNFEYENDRVKEYFEDFNLVKKKIGSDMARTVKKRYDQLKAASSFGIYLDTGLGKPHALFGDLKGCFGINISGNVRLVVKPRTESLEPEILRKCDTVVIMGVVDYHGNKKEWFIP